MARETYRHKAVSVTLGGGLNLFIERMRLEIPEEVTAAVEAGVDELVLEPARSEWPVKTGISKRGLSRVTVPRSGGGALVKVQGKAIYTRWIRQRGYSEPKTWSRLVEVPAREKAGELYQRAFSRLLEVIRAR